MVNRVKNDNDDDICSKHMHLLLGLGRDFQQAFIKFFKLNFFALCCLPAAHTPPNHLPYTFPKITSIDGGGPALPCYAQRELRRNELFKRFFQSISRAPSLLSYSFKIS